ncbi:MAG: GntR family transcriptional regulator [Streptosporangiaceae bacterium]|nr:GntR family transcriptional regulator [Streptosporangiaceae bacterium]
MAEAMYKQIAWDLQRQIDSGLLKPGQQLPTELELRDKYEASRNTIRDTIKWLTNRALVETRPGQGTFVVKRLSPFVTTLSADPETGLGGDEGDAALSEIMERGRNPRSSTPRVELSQPLRQQERPLREAPLPRVAGIWRRSHGRTDVPAHRR